MPEHTTNYYNTFIQVATDTGVHEAEVPPLRTSGKSVANYQYEFLMQQPYTFTSDELLLKIYMLRKAISPVNIEETRMNFFSKGQPCFRASPLTKRYGWGVHFDSEGKMALVPLGSEAYELKVKHPELKQVFAMRTNRQKNK